MFTPFPQKISTPSSLIKKQHNEEIIRFKDLIEGNRSTFLGLGNNHAMASITRSSSTTTSLNGVDNFFNVSTRQLCDNGSTLNLKDGIHLDLLLEMV